MPGTKRMDLWRLLEPWWMEHARDYPWRKSGIDPYGIALAEVLLRRTTATAASRVFPLIYMEFSTPNSLANADVKRLAHLLEPVGLNSQRAIGLRKMGEYLAEKWGGFIPASLPELELVPGLGPYSSRAVMSFAFDQPHAVVDSNVVRIIGRVYAEDLASTSIRDVQAIVDDLVPDMHHKEFNWAMLDLGALVCRYVRPKCDRCPLFVLCNHVKGNHISI